MPQDRKTIQKRYRETDNGSADKAKDAKRKREERAMNKESDPSWKKALMNQRAAARMQKKRNLDKLKKVNIHRMKDGLQLLTLEEMTGQKTLQQLTPLPQTALPACAGSRRSRRLLVDDESIETSSLDTTLHTTIELASPRYI